VFQIQKKLKNSLGRAGVLSAPHGDVLTPAFVTVGTKATVKSLSTEQVKEASSAIVLANTYHLYLEPGEKIIKKAGGLHKFMNWPGPTMTDSGGFQAFSLGVAFGNNLSKFIGSKSPGWKEIDEAYREGQEKKAKITEDGVEFRSIINGSKHFFTPEKSIQIQNDLGADIIFAFDECTSPHAPKKYLEEAMERTHRWAQRCFDFHKNKKQSLFGIVQGGRHEDLRKKSAKTIGQMGFEGFGIGGSFVKEDMATAVKWVNEILPEENPRHLLGVGEPVDLILGAENGCDTFDCVSPTRLGRNGTLFSHKGKVHILNSKFRNLLEPIEKGCLCHTCQNYSAAYVAHLFRSKEMLGATLASVHNLYFLNNLMSQIRESILDGKFFELKENFLKNYK